MSFRGCDTPLPCAPGTSPFHIKGEFYRSIVEAVEQVDAVTKGALKKRLADEGLLAFLGQRFLASQMYDVLPLPRIVTAIAGVLGRDLHPFTERMGRISAEAQFQGTYKALFSGVTIDNFTRRVNDTVQQFYDFGRIIIKATEPNHFHLVRSRVPLCVAEWWCLVSVPFVALLLERASGKNVTVDWSVTENGARDGIALADCDWHLRW